MTITAKKVCKHASKFHDGQTRRSGEAYIHHPMRVFHTLKSYKLPEEVCLAGILHDVLEDTSTTYEEIYKKYGERIAHLVFAVSKDDENDEIYKDVHDKIKWHGILDNNVFLIKLADRLDNIATIKYLKPERQPAYIAETEELLTMIKNIRSSIKGRSLFVINDLIIRIEREISKWRSIQYY